MAFSETRTLSDFDASDAETDIEGLVGYNMKRAYVAMEKDFRAALGAGGLTPRSFSALSLVVNLPQISQSDVARRLGIERSGLVAIIDDLEARGYLVRRVMPDDRRVQALEATDSGGEAYRAALAAVRAHEARLLADLSEAQKAELMESLRRIRLTERES